MLPSLFSVAVYHEEVPLLLKDVSALLIQLVLTMPATMQQGAFVTRLIKNKHPLSIHYDMFLIQIFLLSFGEIQKFH